ncbi:hypothetical protein [Streptomyces sp. NPDC001880]
MPATAVHSGKECGEVPLDTDPASASLELHCPTEGLALELGSAPDADASAAVLGLVAARVRAAIPGRCRQYE